MPHPSLQAPAPEVTQQRPYIEAGPTISQGLVPPPQPLPSVIRTDEDSELERLLSGEPAILERMLKNVLWPITFIVFLLFLGVYIGPWLVDRWRSAELKADGDSAFEKRRGELKAEAEAAEKSLEKLDQRFPAASLGFREVFKKVAPSLVTVSAMREPRPDDARPLGRLSPALVDPQDQTTYLQRSACCGVLVKPGVVLCSGKSMKGIDRLRIGFASGASLWLDLPRHLKMDPVSELAVIHLPDDLQEGLAADAAQAALLPHSGEETQTGDLILAMTTTGDLQNVLAQGLVSGKAQFLDRGVEGELFPIQAGTVGVDQAGVVFDLRGRLVGVLLEQSKEGQTGTSRWVVPALPAKRIAEQLVTRGEVARGWIGATLNALPLRDAKALELESQMGVEVATLTPNQPAARAGMKKGDVIIRYNNQPISVANPVAQVQHQILITPHDAEVPIEIIRGSQRMTINVRVGKRPADVGN